MLGVFRVDWFWAFFYKWFNTEIDHLSILFFYTSNPQLLRRGCFSFQLKGHWLQQKQQRNYFRILYCGGSLISKYCIPLHTITLHHIPLINYISYMTYNYRISDKIWSLFGTCFSAMDSSGEMAYSDENASIEDEPSESSDSMDLNNYWPTIDSCVQYTTALVNIQRAKRIESCLVDIIGIFPSFVQARHHLLRWVWGRSEAIQLRSGALRDFQELDRSAGVAAPLCGSWLHAPQFRGQVWGRRHPWEHLWGRCSWSGLWVQESNFPKYLWGGGGFRVQRERGWDWKFRFPWFRSGFCKLSRWPFETTKGPWAPSECFRGLQFIIRQWAQARHQKSRWGLWSQFEA